MVTFVATMYHEEHYPLIQSLLCQTDPEWKLIVYHNGPNNAIRDEIRALQDSRVFYVHSEENTGYWGAKNRHLALELVNTPYIVQTSVQDYYLPNTVAEIKQKAFTPFIYWNSINHLIGYHLTLDCEPQPGRIDWGNFAVSTEIARSVGINHPEEFMGDWFFVADLMERKLPTVKINQILTIHN